MNDIAINKLKNSEKCKRYAENRILSMSKKEKEKFKNLEREMNRYISDGYVLKHIEFIDFVFNKYLAKYNLTKEKLSSDSSPLLYKNNIHEMDFIELIVLLFYYFEKDINTSLVKFKKYRLLLSLFKELSPLIIFYVELIESGDADYLDENLENLTEKELKARFMIALSRKDSRTAFKIMGRLKKLDLGEDDYLTGILYFYDLDYQKASHYLERVNKEDLDYNAALVARLECYSRLGDMRNFLGCLKSNTDIKKDKYMIDYFSRLLTYNLRAPIDKTCTDETDITFAINCFVPEKSIYKGYCFQLIVKVFLEGFNIYDEIFEIEDLVQDECDIPEAKIRRLSQLDETLRPENYLNIYYIDERGYLTVKKEAYEYIKKLFYGGKLYFLENRDDLDNITYFFRFQLGSGFYDDYLADFSNNLGTFIKFANLGIDEARSLLLQGYSEKIIHGQLIESDLEKYIQSQNCDSIEKTIQYKKIVSSLSPKGKLIFRAAFIDFANSSEEEYWFRDSGMLSLGFFRVIEHELNERIVAPLFNSVGIDKIKSIYDGDYNKNNLNSIKKNKEYDERWGDIIGIFEKRGALELGAMERLFGYISRRSKSKDTLTIELRNSLLTLLTEDGIRAYEETYFEKIINSENREKFRNPPSHTRCLSYKTACECKDFVIKTLEELSIYIK